MTSAVTVRRTVQHLLALLALLAGTVAVAQRAPASMTMQAEAVAADTWVVQGLAEMGSAANQNFISNAAFVITPDGVLVVDALGSPPLAQRLLALIRQRSAAPVRYVVVTHCHADHLYGLQVFKDAGARIVAHVGCRDYLHSDAARLRLQAAREDLAPWVDEHTRLVMPDLWLGDGGRSDDLVLALGDRRFTVRHAGPAHTAEDLVVHDARSGVVFAGDLVFRGRVPFVGQADSRRWIQALDGLLAMQPQVLVPGHGPVSRQPAADLAHTRDYLAYLRQTMGPAARNLDSFDEAYARVDWSRFSAWPLFAATNRINAYNTFLLMEQEGR
jgi:glyoxylase-like metal-dependent hydrolase (beta-lactamase superfamily II)